MPENLNDEFILPYLDMSIPETDLEKYIMQFMELDAYEVEFMFLNYFGIDYRTVMDNNNLFLKSNHEYAVVYVNNVRVAYFHGHCTFDTEILDMLRDRLLLEDTVCEPHCVTFEILPSPTPYVTPTPWQ